MDGKQSFCVCVLDGEGGEGGSSSWTGRLLTLYYDDLMNSVSAITIELKDFYLICYFRSAIISVCREAVMISSSGREGIAQMAKRPFSIGQSVFTS